MPPRYLQTVNFASLYYQEVIFITFYVIRLSINPVFCLQNKPVQ